MAYPMAAPQYINTGFSNQFSPRSRGRDVVPAQIHLARYGRISRFVGPQESNSTQLVEKEDITESGKCSGDEVVEVVV